MYASSASSLRSLSRGNGRTPRMADGGNSPIFEGEKASSIALSVLPSMFASALCMSESKASQYHLRNHRCATRFRTRHRRSSSTLSFFSSTASIQRRMKPRRFLTVMRSRFLCASRLTNPPHWCAARHSRKAFARSRSESLDAIATPRATAKRARLAPSTCASHVRHAVASARLATRLKMVRAVRHRPKSESHAAKALETVF
mmetsp:Transcript_4281/g.17685  ORF Transcript_4281/g.17685 Transcript_4281/m.17685 type:complete len:202 (+) Transcript_4281:288-893(+)